MWKHDVERRATRQLHKILLRDEHFKTAPKDTDGVEVAHEPITMGESVSWDMQI